MFMAKIQTKFLIIFATLLLCANLQAGFICGGFDRETGKTISVEALSEEFSHGLSKVKGAKVVVYKLDDSLDYSYEIAKEDITEYFSDAVLKEDSENGDTAIVIAGLRAFVGGFFPINISHSGANLASGHHTEWGAIKNELTNPERKKDNSNTMKLWTGKGRNTFPIPMFDLKDVICLRTNDTSDEE